VRCLLQQEASRSGWSVCEQLLRGQDMECWGIALQGFYGFVD
jgi:hypothetical protein